MAFVAPWLVQNNPLDFMRQGAALGLQIRAQRAAEEQALARNELAQQELAQQRELATARAAEALRQHNAMEAYRRSQSALGERRLNIEEAANQLRAARPFAPSELERSMEYALKKGYITPEQAPIFAQEHFQGPTETMEMSTDESGRPVYRMQKGRGASSKQLGTPTVGFQTKLQEQLANDAGTMELLGIMQNNMTDADFGLRGIGRDLKVKLGGQLGLDVENEDLSVRKTIPLLRAALIKALKSDSNIAEPERKNIEKALPNEGWLESRKNAEESIRVLTPWIRNRARRSAAELGGQLPIWAMNAEEIKAAVKSNRISEDQAVQAIQQFNIPIPGTP